MSGIFNNFSSLADLSHYLTLQSLAKPWGCQWDNDQRQVLSMITIADYKAGKEHHSWSRSKPNLTTSCLVMSHSTPNQLWHSRIIFSNNLIRPSWKLYIIPSGHHTKKKHWGSSIQNTKPQPNIKNFTNPSIRRETSKISHVNMGNTMKVEVIFIDFEVQWMFWVLWNLNYNICHRRYFIFM